MELIEAAQYVASLSGEYPSPEGGVDWDAVCERIGVDPDEFTLAGAEWLASWDKYEGEASDEYRNIGAHGFLYGMATAWVARGTTTS